MRVLFTTYPEKTHFLAMAPLAWALRTAGHEVRVACQPKFTDVVTQAGLTAVPIGPDRDLWQLMSRDLNWFSLGLNGLPVPYDTVDWRPQDVTWDYLKDGYDIHVPKWHKMSNVPMIPDLVEFARSWQPDLVVWEPSTYAGAVAAEAVGAAHARILFSLDTYGVARDHFLRLREQQPPEDRADPLGEWLAPYADRYGFEFSESLITGQFTITQLPPSLGIEADLTYEPLRYVPYGGPAVVPQWLSTPPERPRVALTMGLSVGATAADVLQLEDVFEEIADLDVEVVATLPEQAQKSIAKVPDNVRMVSYVPLHALIPTCTAVIHHAGYGTLATTALHGKPQIIVTWNADGPTLARRVAAQGAGLSLHVGQAVAWGVMRNRLTRILTEPRFTEAAGRLRDEIQAMPSPNQLAGRLEKLVAEHRRPVAAAS
ncbi:activator-dependent family glycosyltransferase [Amycolatopsis suaedae]|uniref:Activator-dependent family glycosyltransferase n=1 Tax=Amycolatopsis suaedae TaxID=2510978 RepID=A0A4Q7J4E5_9PSEU|nr:activator-dependent family glycosyltransferase [Amycolatopsis suaedae]RZQ61163.1 activator-dependent family glycosyltransferase [Amycolatopsis suaedae]